MVEHRGEITVPAPVSRVFDLFTQFEAFPTFLAHVKEVRASGESSHWKVDLLGMHEWDAKIVRFEANRCVEWKSTSGLQNEGMVLFEELGPQSTRVIAVVRYAPPGGDATEALVSGGAVDRALREELENFAKMVRATPPAGDVRVHAGTIESVERSTSDDGLHRPFERGTLAP